ncbi:hypothetical protein ACFLXB_06890 [Chloroflexota bacterium]
MISKLTKDKPVSVVITLFFLLLNILIWVSFAVIVAADLHPALPDLPQINLITAALAFMAGFFLLGMMILLGKRNRWAYFLSLAALLFIILLTINDDFGLVDLVVLIVEIIPFVLLIKDGKWYLGLKTEKK